MAYIDHPLFVHHGPEGIYVSRFHPTTADRGFIYKHSRRVYGRWQRIEETGVHGIELTRYVFIPKHVAEVTQYV